MKNIKLLFLSIMLPLFIFNYSCEELLNQENGDDLSESEVVEGLKTALKVGTDSSTTMLSVVNGYYGDPLVKIPLPDEAVELKDQLNTILNEVPVLTDYLNLDQEFEKVILSVNRAAEDAASEAAPIFKNAITGLSIADAWDILQGTNPAGTKGTAEAFDSTAATGYFKSVTQPELVDLYAPKIDAALDRDLGLGFSANDAWFELRSNYNNVIEDPYVAFTLQVAGYELEPLQTESIGEFSTNLALDGLFSKVAEEEKKIRRNPLEWAATLVGDILERVFSYFDD